MLVKVEYNLSQMSVISTKEVRLTKDVKALIKDRMIDALEYKDLTVISRIRGATITKMSHTEKNSYLEKTGITENDLQYIAL